jgi:hypothetical protein
MVGYKTKQSADEKRWKTASRQVFKPLFDRLRGDTSCSCDTIGNDDFTKRINAARACFDASNPGNFLKTLTEVEAVLTKGISKPVYEEHDERDTFPDVASFIIGKW